MYAIRSYYEFLEAVQIQGEGRQVGGHRLGVRLPQARLQPAAVAQPGQGVVQGDPDHVALRLIALVDFRRQIFEPQQGEDQSTQTTDRQGSYNFV